MSRELNREMPERRQIKMTTAKLHPLQKVLESRIAIIDGAMGTTIRTYAW
jgi:5-methyltetrahydrofolate--homocysteine methyltransferase